MKLSEIILLGKGKNIKFNCDECIRKCIVEESMLVIIKEDDMKIKLNIGEYLPCGRLINIGKCLKCGKIFFVCNSREGVLYCSHKCLIQVKQAEYYQRIKFK